MGRVIEGAGRPALITGSLAIAATVASAVLRLAGAGEVLIFAATALALASLAAVVGEATDELGARLNPGATGVLQSALGNLPELFICIFALRAGLVIVVQTALIGSILANSLLVLGLAFVVGGLRHGPQRFGADTTRMTAILLVLSVASLAIPTLATAPGAPDFGHARDLSVIASLVLLIVFAASIPASVRGTFGPSHAERVAAP
ncbi:MAG: sodium:proton exchanger, partial [Chloroflexota bacterium]|nr:sodium:proton exchanger [Chloroflexota bacterium]